MKLCDIKKYKYDIAVLYYKYIVIGLLKAKDKKKIIHTNFKGAIIHLIPDFSTETMEAKRQWNDIFQVPRRSLWLPERRMDFGS